jgi:hypothetical protein
METLRVLEEEMKGLAVRSPIDGVIVSWDVEKELIHRPVQRGQILMKVVNPAGDWELVLKVPELDMGFVNEARRSIGEDLPVEYVTATNPGTTRQGKVKEYHRTAEVRDEEGNTVLVRVGIDKQELGDDLVPGATVTSKVHVGRASIGYATFHSLFSWVQKNILFRFF